jgi:site-specific DNA-methyltransferase (adenine-specific)
MPLSNRLRQRHIPDILDCLAQLSNDEVPTPPKLARAMLNILSADVWSNPEMRWLDPFCKSGVFLREIATRLLEGLADWEPDFERRRDHIYRNMVFGTSITEMTGIISRRTLYCSRDASGEHSVVRFDDETGNLAFVPSEHTFGKDGKARSCDVCRAPSDLERGVDRENYAYSFIHGAYPTKEMSDMKFDVIVGNPPYQIDSDGNTRTMPIYQLFIQQAIEMNPRYVLMITPSRWFAGGLGMAEFRTHMLSDRRIKRIVDYRIEKDAFPGVNINGGVNYFLWDRDYDGPCLVSHVRPGGIVGDAESRYLDEFDLFIRQNEAVTILRKVRSHNDPTFESNVSSQKPFEFHTNFHGSESSAGLADPVLLHGARRDTWISRSDIVKNQAWVDQWKVLLPAASDGNEVFPLPIWDMAVGPFVSGPGEVCSGSYLVISPSDDQTSATRTAAYLRTRFVRFLVSLRKIAQHNTVDRFAFVPNLLMDRVWTDEMLYTRYGLTDKETAYIESEIKEMPAPEQAEPV